MNINISKIGIQPGVQITTKARARPVLLKSEGFVSRTLPNRRATPFLKEKQCPIYIKKQ